MDADEARAFLRENHRAVLATTRSDGRPALSPVAVGIDDAGRALISTRETAMKTRHLRKRPYASLCVMNDRFFGSYVQIEGPVEIVPLPGAMELLVDYYRTLAGEHPNWDEYREAMTRERRVMLRLTIERSGPNRQG